MSFSRAREGSTPPTARFRTDGVPIDAAGIGTKMGVSADAPTLDSAYKLVAFGNRQVLKLSAGKATLPGAKQVWRSLPMGEDLLAVRNEPGPAGFEPLLVPVMCASRRLEPPGTIEAAQARLARDLEGLPTAARKLHQPAALAVVVSDCLRSLVTEVTAGLQRGARATHSTGGAQSL